MTGRAARKWGLRIGAGAGLLLVVALAAAYLLARPYGETGTTYAAKQICSCVFLTGRSDASCRAEFEPDLDRFQVRIDHTTRHVDARLAIFSSTSVYEEGLGCRIDGRSP